MLLGWASTTWLPEKSLLTRTRSHSWCGNHRNRQRRLLQPIRTVRIIGCVVSSHEEFTIRTRKGGVNSNGDNGKPAPGGGEATETSPSSTTPRDVVVLNDVSLSFGQNQVLDGLNLSLRYGEGTAIIGSSGTGKSTTLRLICGLEVPTSGYVKIGDWTRKLHISEEASPVKIAMVFQQSALFDSLTIRENVGFELYQHSDLSKERISKLVNSALEEVGLYGVADLMPNELSGGMKKRVSFARAVLYNPDDESTMPRIILYDEPSAGLDPSSSTRIENCIRELQRSVCDTYVVVTHQLSTIRRTADRVVFLHQGRIQWDGKIDEIDTTDNPYVRQFMDARLDGPLDESISYGGRPGNEGELP